MEAVDITPEDLLKDCEAFEGSQTTLEEVLARLVACIFTDALQQGASLIQVHTSSTSVVILLYVQEMMQVCTRPSPILRKGIVRRFQQLAGLRPDLSVGQVGNYLITHGGSQTRCTITTYDFAQETQVNVQLVREPRID